MLKTEDIVRLRHMLDAACKATEYTKACKRTDLDQRTNSNKTPLEMVRK